MNSVITELTYHRSCGTCRQNRKNCMYNCELMISDLKNKLEMLPEGLSDILSLVDISKTSK